MNACVHMCVHMSVVCVLYVFIYEHLLVSDTLAASVSAYRSEFVTLRDIAFVHKKRKVTREEKLAQAKVRIISASSPGSTQRIGSCFDNRAGNIDKNNDRS